MNSKFEEEEMRSRNRNAEGKGKTVVVEGNGTIEEGGYEKEGMAVIEESRVSRDISLDEMIENGPSLHPYRSPKEMKDTCTDNRQSTARIKGRQKEDKSHLWWMVCETTVHKWIDGYKTDGVNLNVFNENLAEVAEDPQGFGRALFRHQMEWLAWALKQGALKIAGGILADEMRMGQTIEAISLILAARVIRPMGCSSSTSTPSPWSVECTLVVCPLVGLDQWKDEIALSTKEGSTKFLVYHGTTRNLHLEQLSECNIVLTTYDTVAAYYKKHSPKDSYVGKELVRLKSRKKNKQIRVLLLPMAVRWLQTKVHHQ